MEDMYRVICVFVRENISRPFISQLGFKVTGDDADPPEKKATGADGGA